MNDIIPFQPDISHNGPKLIIRALKCDKNGKTEKNKENEIIPLSLQNSSIVNINTFIWHLSDIPYSHRYIKKEVIERLRGVITNDKLIEINNLIIKATTSHTLNMDDNEL